jgi:prepilin peptidase CpaA
VLRILIKYVTVIVLLILALVSDYKTYKIKNVIVLPFIILGFIINLIYDGVPGILHSLAAILIPVFLLILLFALRMLGAGDIKLFCAVGSIMGIKFILYALVTSFLCGGVIALAVICFNKNAAKRISHVFTYIKTCLLTRSLQPYSDFNNKIDGSVFHFSYAIACGVLVMSLKLFYEQGFDFFRF